MMDPATRERMTPWCRRRPRIGNDSNSSRFDVARWRAHRRQLHRDFDAMLYRRILNEPAMQLAKGEFGGRVGSGV